ncbi:MAG TPA: LacI family DNA-binding transcriptional regulator [Pyrinomonadaceae bacterium]|nr:LacI family DNA-binding transcriptional regulator [Pyrinomonadaceae bacterium]
MSIKDVAREAGVSTATVSHVINNSRFVTEETRARVLEAVERCDYYPNAHARSLASGRSHILGLLISDIANPFFPELVKSIETAAFERGYDVVLSNTNYDAARTSHYVKRLIERKVSGVALMTSEMDMALVDELARRQVSVVFLDLDAPGPNMSNLCIDYREGIEEAVRHLVALGHSRLAFIGGPERLRSAVKRREAFREAVAKHLPGRPPPAIYEGDFKLEGGRLAARAVLAAKRMPTAVMAANDMMALGAMQEWRAAGLRIPEDLSLVGFDDIAFAALCDPPLTTVCVPRTELGRRAVEALMATLEHPERVGAEVRVPTYLVERGSTAAARTGDVEAKFARGKKSPGRAGGRRGLRAVPAIVKNRE